MSKLNRGHTDSTLRASEARYRRLFEAAQDGILILDADTGVITDVNSFLMRLLDYSREEFIGKTLWDIGAFRQIQESKAAFRELQNKEYIRYDNLPLETKSGRRVSVEFVSNVYDENGKSVIQCNIRDVTARKQSEASLQESQQHLAAILASAMDAIITVDGQQRIMLFNAAAEKMFRCSESEVLGQSIERFIPQRFHAAHSGHIRSFGQTGVTKRVMGALEPLWALRSDGEEFEIEASISHTESGGKKIFTVIMRDVSKREQSEDALRKSEERFSKAFRSNPLAITISTAGEGRYLDVNDSFLDLLGCRRKDVIGRTAEELRFWSEPLDRAEMLRQLREEERVARQHTRYRTAKGEIREAEVWAELIELDGQRCVLAITRDLTEIQLLEAQVRQAQKMEAVGRLAGGVAHDFNNLLGVMLGYADLSLALVPPDNPLNRYLLQITKASGRAALLTRQLLAFSRKQVAFTRILDLNEVVHNATSMFLRLVGEDIAVEFRPTNPLGSIKADPSQIEQVLMNLVVNARDAMPIGGKIIIETAEAEMDEHYVSLHPGSHAGQHVVLVVSDTGCGMDESIKSQIFEPFFTTKALGQGTGLGLSTVYGIVKQSEGYILVYSEPGKGTTFKIYFPRVYEKAEKLVLSHEEAEPPGGSETILVVEDDDTLRELTVKLLQDGGYRVVEATNADDGLRIMAASLPVVDLLLTDVIMPGTSGVELVKQAREGHPKLRSLFMSGYSDYLVGRQGVLTQDASFLEKPFTKRSLLAKVYAALHGDSTKRQ
ncbi:MAG TPA: PAS domain S-box protein [Candidatus Dormibacteraeota bacterium]|nr:PAS domain S-box protein [Candidatus Dormibacteraeota bacterium]